MSQTRVSSLNVLMAFTSLFASCAQFIDPASLSVDGVWVQVPEWWHRVAFAAVIPAGRRRYALHASTVWMAVALAAGVTRTIEVQYLPFPGRLWPMAAGAMLVAGPLTAMRAASLRGLIR